MTNIEKYKEKIAELGDLNQQVVQNELCSADRIQKLIDILQDKINNFKPKMMVYGVYNAGKSTIINTLVGKEVAPTGDTPETKEVCGYKYKEYEIFDTPGLNAPIDDEITTEEYYKQCELILFVVSGESVENDYIYKKIRKIIDDKKSGIIILNLKQNYSDEEQRKLEGAIYLNLSKNGFSKEDIGNGKSIISVCSINAYSAFNGKTQNKPKLYEKSGFGKLEETIDRLFYNSKEDNIIYLCNKNINDFINDINNSIIERIDDKALKIVENFINQVYRDKSVKTMELKRNVDSGLEALKNRLLQEELDDININAELQEGIYELKDNIENNIKGQIEDLKQRIGNVSDTIAELDIGDEYSIDLKLAETVKVIEAVKEGGLFDTVVDTVLGMLGTIPRIVLFPFMGLFKDNKEEHERQQEELMRIVNEINDEIKQVAEKFHISIDKVMAEIYNPIIQMEIGKKEKLEQNQKNLLDIKNKIALLGQGLPTASI